MSLSADPRRMFSDRSHDYARFICAVGYVRGLRRFFASWPALERAQRILDAGCGTGAVTLAVHEALVQRRLSGRVLHAFDLTPEMLALLRQALGQQAQEVELAEADVLAIEGLPPAWTGYDLIVSASMLEYVPRERLEEALVNLRSRLDARGRFLLFITRRNWLTRPLVGRWWQSNLYAADEIERALRGAGFSAVRFGRFPIAARHLALWGHVIEAQR
jgi:ubiquinone/menaquinone biosynthesis C-methylase UbiE